MDFSDLKIRAKKSLSGHWKDTLIVLIVFGVLTGITSTFNIGNEPSNTEVAVAGLLSLIGLVITCLLGFGYINYFLKLSRDEKSDYRELFSKTNLAVDYFVIALLVGIFTFLWSLLFIIPGIIAAIRYSQAFYIKLDNPDLNAIECIDKSKELMKNHKMDYFLLCLSFIGWAILGIFTLFILYFWLVPYYATTLCNFYNKIKDEK